MKKLILFVSVSTLLLFGYACKKAEITEPSAVNEVVEVSLAKNEKYAYILPATDAAMAFAVSSQNNTGATSQVEGSSSGAVFNYTPPTDFSGTDMVIVSTTAAPANYPSNGCGHPEHQSGEHHGDHHGNHHGSCGNSQPQGQPNKCGSGSKSRHHHHDKEDNDAHQNRKHCITFHITIKGDVN